MSILGLLIFAGVCVLAFYLVRKIPDATVQNWVAIVLAILLILWLLEAVGILSGLGLTTPVWRYR